MLGHVLLCVSEVSFFFVSALATVAMFDHWRRSQFVFWKLMLLASALFAFFCYKRQLASVGDALLETQPGDAGKTPIEPKGTAKPWKTAARSYSDGSSSDPIVDPNDTAGFTEGRGINNYAQLQSAVD